LQVFSLLKLAIHASPSPSPFIVLLPLFAPLWIVVLPLHFCAWLYFHLNNVLLPCIHLDYLCFHKVMFHNFVFVWIFNEHWICWCSSWSCWLSCTPTSYASTQKLNCKCSNFIYIMNYRLRKLHLFIVHFSFCTFQKWWWMQHWPYN
jgi:hypothetical protein